MAGKAIQNRRTLPLQNTTIQRSRWYSTRKEGRKEGRKTRPIRRMDTTEEGPKRTVVSKWETKHRTEWSGEASLGRSRLELGCSCNMNMSVGNGANRPALQPAQRGSRVRSCYVVRRVPFPVSSGSSGCLYSGVIFIPTQILGPHQICVLI